MKKNRIVLMACLVGMLTSVSSFVFSAEFSVCEYGAIADGKTVCTEAIQKAIDTCGSYFRRERI